MERIRSTSIGRILGITSPTTTLQGLLKYRDLVLKAARTVVGNVSDVVAQQKWRWAKVHNLSLECYMGESRWPLQAPGGA